MSGEDTATINGARGEAGDGRPGGTAGGVAAPLRLSLDLPTGRQYLASLRQAVVSLLESFGVAEGDRDDVEVLLGELATNAVMHAGVDNFRVEVEFWDGWVAVVVSDEGRGFLDAGLPPPGTVRSMAPGMATPDGAGERYGGWGLPLVYRLADRVEIRANQPKGTTVRAEKRVTGSFPLNPKGAAGGAAPRS